MWDKKFDNNLGGYVKTLSDEYGNVRIEIASSGLCSATWTIYDVTGKVLECGIDAPRHAQLTALERLVVHLINNVDKI